jgi:segregation and condensation protein B
MEVPEIKPVVEALLFVSDTPLTAARLKEVLGNVAQKKVAAAIEELKAEYEAGARAFTISEVAEGYLLTTLPAHAEWVKKLYKGRLTSRLSKPSLETLAIIAFKQPVTRTAIEAIRGVDSSGVLAYLLERKLVAISGRDSSPGKPLVYITTKDFLRYFGLNKLSDLPRPRELEELLREREAEQQELFPEKSLAASPSAVPDSGAKPVPAPADVSAGEATVFTRPHQDGAVADPIPGEQSPAAPPGHAPAGPAGQIPDESEELSNAPPQ